MIVETCNFPRFVDVQSGEDVRLNYTWSAPVVTDVQIPEDYISGALRDLNLEQLEDGTFVATIPEFDGVWAAGLTENEAIQSLRGVLMGWLLLKMEDRDGDIPKINGINLNT